MLITIDLLGSVVWRWVLVVVHLLRLRF